MAYYIVAIASLSQKAISQQVVEAPTKQMALRSVLSMIPTWATEAADRDGYLYLDDTLASAFCIGEDYEG